MRTPRSDVKRATRASIVKALWSLVLCVLVVLALLLGRMGVLSIAHGVDDAAGLTDTSKGVYVLLGCAQLFGAALMLFGLVRLARTWRLLPSPERAPAADTSIRERALANQRAAQSSQS